MQPSIPMSPIDLRFRRALGRCLLGISVSLFGVVAFLSPTVTAPLLFGLLGVLLVFIGAVSMMGAA